jgi:hypothetical protein
MDVHVGSFKTTTASIDVVCPFRPRVVHLYLSGGDEAVWTEDMGDGAAFKRVSATGSLVTADGITPLDDGFTLGVDADLNLAGGTVYFEAQE